MRIRFVAIAALSLASLSAQAGTVVFLTGVPSKPTVGVDGWSSSSSGDVVSMSVGHTEHATLGPDVYVEEVTGTFGHTHRLYPPPRPEVGTESALGSTAGTVFWWFEYVPGSPFDVPVGSFEADVQIRGWAWVTQVAISYALGGSVNIVGSINGVLTQAGGTTACGGGGGFASNTFATTGNPWGFQEVTLGFSFSWDATLQKWIGKAEFLNAAVTQFNSIITLADDSDGRESMEFKRQLKVLRVRTPSGWVFTFNAIPWT